MDGEDDVKTGSLTRGTSGDLLLREASEPLAFTSLGLKIGGGCETRTRGLIGLIEYSYHQGASSFLEACLERTSRLSVLGLEQFQDW